MISPNPIELAERDIQRDKDDLKRLKKRYPGYDFIRVDTIRQDAVIHDTKPVKSGLSELEEEVLKTVDGSPEKEWTSRNVVEALRATDFKLAEKDDAAMNAVGYALIALKESGKILRSHEGRGRDPHRYTANPFEGKKEEFLL